MQIKEVEEKTGLTRSNIRFYEKQNLITPLRNSNSGYREYSEENVRDIMKIAYLRTLGISIEDIQKIIKGEKTLYETIKVQEQVLDSQIDDLQKAQELCRKMLLSEDITYEKLNVEYYVTEVEAHWKSNSKLLKLDSVSFLYVWSGFVVWGIITALCFIIASLSFVHLPGKIPVQWSEGNVSSEVNKIFIFAYPIICVVFRFALRPYIGRWLEIRAIFSDTITNYVINFLCFVVLSIEIFSILYIYGIVHSIVTLLLVDTVIFMSILIIGWNKFYPKSS